MKKTNRQNTKKPPVKPHKSFSLYAIAKGKPGKTFTIKQFLEITKNAKKKPSGANTNRTIKLNDGYVYHADSQQEISVVKKLISYDAFKRLRGQCLNIAYRYSGKNHNYYPDFVLLTQTNKIVIIEVKEIVQMCTKQNLRKYSALKRYCERNGYLYVMCDKRFTTFEQLSTSSYNSKVFDTIDLCLLRKGYFDYQDYRDLIDGKDKNKIKSYRRAIGIYVASHEDVKMIGDLTFKSKDFKIKKK